MLNVERFLQDYNIEYVLEGPNVKKGNINVACPWCGDDPSHHMGIEPNKGWYGCWRNTKHRGKNLARLLAAISPLTYSDAQAAVGHNLTELSVTDFQAIADGSFFTMPKEGVKNSVVTSVDLLHNFRQLRVGIPGAAIGSYLHYLHSRGLDWKEVDRICKCFSLLYCVGGSWRNRVIIPVYMEHRLMCWTSRSIYPNAEVPYMALDKESSVLNIKECLYNFDSACATGGEVLFLVEGPGDVWRLDLVARKYNCRAVGLFSLSCEEGQLYWFDALVLGFKKLVILVDRNELVAGQVLLDTLAYLSITIELGELPKGVKDPGELTDDQASVLCVECLVNE